MGMMDYDNKTRKRDATKVKSYAFGDGEHFVPEIKTGTILDDRYQVIGKVGEGSYGAVYQVFDRKMDIPKALKVFGRREESMHIIADLREEARMLARINHPNIIRIFDFNETGEYIYLDTEYVEGGNLEDNLQKLRKSDKSIRRAARQIAEGLKEAHDQGIIHMDIKPANLLLDRVRNIKISDFGIAGQLGLKLHSTAGTPTYMAPEHIEGRPADQRSDIFSFGIVLYQMVYGNYPFKLDRDGNYIYDLPHHLYKDASDLNSIILKCIAANPEHRYTDFAPIINELKESQRKAPAGSKRPGFGLFFRNQMQEIAGDLRKESRNLMILLILLLLIIPFYLKIIRRLSEEQNPVHIDGPPMSTSVNMQPESSLSPDRLQKGDLVQLHDLRRGGEPTFEFFYNGEDPLSIRFDGNRVYLDNRLAGIHVRDRGDLPLPPNLDFIHSDIELSADDLSNQRNPNLAVRLGEMVSGRTMENLPANTRFLDLWKNQRISDLRSLNHLRNLEGLDIEAIHDFYPGGLMQLRQLKWLDLAGNDLESLDAVRSLANLEHLDISRNRLQGLATLRHQRALQSVRNQGNPQLPESDRQWLDEKNKHYAQERQQEEPSRQQIIWHRSTVMDKIVFGLALLVLILVVYQLLRLIRKNLPALLPDKKKKEEKPVLPPEFHDRLKKADAQEKENQLWTPTEDNALRTLHNLAVEFPNERQVRSREKGILHEAERKIRQYMAREEFEPAYLNLQSVLSVTGNSKLRKYRKRCLEKLVHEEPVKMIAIPGGSFRMGDFENETLSNAVPLHEVTLSDFSLSETTVTNHQFCEFLNAVGKHSEPLYEWINLSSPYCRIRRTDRGKYETVEPYSSFPVIEVSWYGAKRFCEWFGGRLPTEAEWEYAARNKGRKILFSQGNRPDRGKMNYLVDKSDNRWHSVFPVKSLPPGPLGLYEMSGNLLEWCQDYYDSEYYSESDSTNPQGPERSTLKSVRGGGWCFPFKHMKSYYRGSAKPTARNNFIGFRVAK